MPNFVDDEGRCECRLFPSDYGHDPRCIYGMNKNTSKKDIGKKMSAKFQTTQRAKVPLCWVCDRKLYAGGRSYVTITDEQGNEHPAHKSCAEHADK